MILPKRTKVHLMSDYGGTLVDPFPENFRILDMTSREAGLGYFFPFSKETTRYEIRPYIAYPRDYYIIARAKQDGADYKSPGKLEMLRKDKAYRELGAMGEKAFREVRTEWHKQDPNGRLQNIKIFPGAKEFIEKVHSMPGVAFSIITTTKAWNVRSRLGILLERLNTPSINIFDVEYGYEHHYDHINPRDYQFFKMEKEGFLVPQSLTLDDLPENLEAAERWEVSPFAVGHGYGVPEMLSKYQKVTFEEMLDIVSDLSKG